MLKLTAPLTALTGGDPVVYDITEDLPSMPTSTTPTYSEQFDLPVGRYAIEVRVTNTGSTSTAYYLAIRLVDSAGNSVMGYAVPAHDSWLPEQATVFYPTITAPGAYRISMQSNYTSARGRIDRIRVIRLPTVPLLVGVADGSAHDALRTWAVSIGKTHETITEIHMPIKVVGPSLDSLFAGWKALTTVPKFDTSQVTDMSAMFNRCSSLTSVPALDTSQVTDMGTMFYGCSSLTSIPDLDTSQVTDMGTMFYGCSSLTSIPDLDTSKVMLTFYMFNDCSSLESVTLTGMGNGFTNNQTLRMYDTKLNAAAANALMESLGTPPPGGTLQLPATSAGADTSIAEAKNWTVTVG